MSSKSLTRCVTQKVSSDRSRQNPESGERWVTKSRAILRQFVSVRESRCLIRPYRLESGVFVPIIVYTEIRTLMQRPVNVRDENATGSRLVPRGPGAAGVQPSGDTTDSEISAVASGMAARADEQPADDQTNWRRPATADGRRTDRITMSCPWHFGDQWWRARHSTAVPCIGRHAVHRVRGGLAGSGQSAITRSVAIPRQSISYSSPITGGRQNCQVRPCRAAPRATISVARNG